MLTFLAALTASDAKNPDSYPGSLTRAECNKKLTDCIVVWFWWNICHFDESLSFFNSWLKAETCVKDSDVLVDSFKQDTDSDSEFSSFNFFVNHGCWLECTAGTDQVNLVDVSFKQGINDFLDMEFSFFKPQEASPVMMDGLDHWGLQLNDWRRIFLVFVVSLKWILNSEYLIDVVDLL